jgi:hypothetical protein
MHNDVEVGLRDSVYVRGFPAARRPWCFDRTCHGEGARGWPRGSLPRRLTQPQLTFTGVDAAQETEDLPREEDHDPLTFR